MQLLKSLFNVIIALSAIALIFFMLINVLRLSIPYSTNDEGYHIYGHLFLTKDMYLERMRGVPYYRIQSLFWEPGVYSIYLVFAIYYYAFIDEEKDKRKLCLLLLCLFLTVSTTGLILGIVVFGILIIKSFKRSSTNIIIMLPIVIASAVGIYNVWMAKKNALSPSYGLRLYDLTRGFEIWKRHFLFGTGYGDMSEFDSALRTGNSNGFISWCMMMGLWGLVPVVLTFVINIIRSGKEKKIAHAVSFGVFVIANMSEPLMITSYMTMIIAYEYIIAIRVLKDNSYVRFGGKECSFNLP